MILRYLPNMITSIRIIGTAGLLFIEPLTLMFYIVYTIAGISDVLDGWTARKLKVTSEFGSKLDSAADLLYYAMMVFKVFPVLWEILPVWIWIMVAATVVIRIISYTLAAIKFHRFASLHTYMNKATSMVAFTIPYALKTSQDVLVCAVCSIVMGLAAIEELIMHIRMKEYSTNEKSLVLGA